MAEGKGDLEGLRSATKCPSLEVTHITSAPNPLVRRVRFSQQQGSRKYNPTLSPESRELEAIRKPTSWPPHLFSSLLISSTAWWNSFNPVKSENVSHSGGHLSFVTPMDCSHNLSYRIVKARLLKWVATSCSRGSSWNLG